MIATQVLEKQEGKVSEYLMNFHSDNVPIRLITLAFASRMVAKKIVNLAKDNEARGTGRISPVLLKRRIAMKEAFLNRMQELYLEVRNMPPMWNRCSSRGFAACVSMRPAAALNIFLSIARHGSARPSAICPQSFYIHRGTPGQSSLCISPGCSICRSLVPSSAVEVLDVQRGRLGAWICVRHRAVRARRSPPNWRHTGFLLSNEIEPKACPMMLLVQHGAAGLQ